MGKRNKTPKREPEEAKKEAVEIQEPVIVEETQPEKTVSREELIIKRDTLINDLRERLLTKLELWKGGREVRGRHAEENKAYQPVVDEINKLGKQLDLGEVTLGSLRRE